MAIPEPVNDPELERLLIWWGERGSKEHARRCGVKKLWMCVEEEHVGFYTYGKRPVKQPGVDKIRRNDPCFCGSGKKYKKCHGR